MFLFFGVPFYEAFLITLVQTLEICKGIFLSFCTFFLFVCLHVVLLWVFKFVSYLWDVFIFQVLVESVLYLTYSAAYQWDHFGNLGPFGADKSMLLEDEEVFFLCPFSSYDLWVDHVVPSLSTLATKPARQESRYDYPILCAKMFHLLAKNSVFLGAPLCAAELRRYAQSTAVAVVVLLAL